VFYLCFQRCYHLLIQLYIELICGPQIIAPNHSWLIVFAQLVKPKSVLDELVMRKQVVDFFVDEVFLSQILKHFKKCRSREHHAFLSAQNISAVVALHAPARAIQATAAVR
jgi:hypothetical protein